MNRGNRVKIEKLDSTIPAELPAGDWAGWEAGKINYGYSLPVDYWVEGDLKADIEVGYSVRLDRYIRNGLEIDGVFVTSPVTDIIVTTTGQYLVITKNSIYRVTAQ